MLVEYWSYSGVLATGRFENDPEGLKGSVDIDPFIKTSGNHHLQTPSTKKSGFWLSVSSGRLADGTIHGITIFFKDENEMRAFNELRKAGIDHRKDEEPPDETSSADWWKF